LPGPDIIIAVDAMSGDRGCEAGSQGCGIRSIRKQGLEDCAAGQQSNSRGLFVRKHERIEVVDASQVVTMDERPSHALRHKQSSSMAAALRMVAEGRADGCVSAGNTGRSWPWGAISCAPIPV